MGVDYFDRKYAELAIEEKFQTRSVEWVQPNDKKIVSIRNKSDEYTDSIDLAVRHNEKIFALALLSDKALHAKYISMPNG